MPLSVGLCVWSEKSLTRRKLVQKDRAFDESLQEAIADEGAFREVKQLQGSTQGATQ